MTSEFEQIPQALAVVLAQSARAVVRGMREYRAVGDPGRSFDYATMLRVYEAEILWLLKAWIELETEQRYSIRRVEASLLQRCGTPLGESFVAFVCCQFERPSSEPISALYPDEHIYALCTPEGSTEEVEVRRLLLF